ncbi:trypsin-like peptidase domain-containing protein [Ramlibacter sp. CrO1]|uniref:Trypsin-like peptidase domain-containing protein n=1 Tax=Ramlibacter algicola TaxID=2795217 RepID=A0A934Q3Z8_9BURK|nr:trypsin-like peptidase domain-containing protein [Ramlibacter algicola]
MHTAGSPPSAPSAATAPVGAEPLLLTTTRLSTFQGQQLLTGATGFFFRRDGRLFVVTSSHVLRDEVSGHHPDRIELVLHVDRTNLTRVVNYSVLLYQSGQPVWRQGEDSAGPVDIAVLELDAANLPADLAVSAFEPRHLASASDGVEVGQSLRVTGFPLGFFDTVHHLPVVRHAIVASSFGVRFQGLGYFLTDGRMHRGSSGAPVVMRCDQLGAALPWRLLGVHSSRMDMGNRDRVEDDMLGLNCAWYADMLMTLTR